VNRVHRIKGFGVRHHKYLIFTIIRIRPQEIGYWRIVFVAFAVSVVSIFKNASLFPEPQQAMILYKRLLDFRIIQPLALSQQSCHIA